MNESLPNSFVLEFSPLPDGFIKVSIDGKAIGDPLRDNSRETDFYRYHDVFHFAFATILDWSPCARALTHCKRKSDKVIDEVEDGARARSIEEGISAIIFEDALVNQFYRDKSIDDEKLQLIISSTRRLEVGAVDISVWRMAIDKGYAAFRFLAKNGGGKILFDRKRREIHPLISE